MWSFTSATGDDEVIFIGLLDRPRKWTIPITCRTVASLFVLASPEWQRPFLDLRSCVTIIVVHVVIICLYV